MGNSSSKSKKKCKVCKREINICENESYYSYIDILKDVWLFDETHSNVIINYLQNNLNMSSYDFVISLLQSYLTTKKDIDNKLKIMNIEQSVTCFSNNNIDNIYHAYCHGNQYVDNIIPCINKLSDLSRDKNKWTLPILLWSERDGVGKSALFYRFVLNKYLNDWDPTIADEAQKCIVYENTERKTEIEISLYDCSALHWGGSCLDGGQFSGKSYYGRTASLFLIIYSIDNRESFQDVKKGIKIILDRVKDVKTFPMIIVATKCDLRYNEDKYKDNLVTTEEGIKLAQTLKLPYIETSAKDNRNIDLLFRQCIYEYCAMDITD